MRAAGETAKLYGPASLPPSLQNVAIAMSWPLFVVVRIGFQSDGAVIVGIVPAPSCAVIVTTMTSVASVPDGRLMLSDPALVAVPVVALTTARTAMIVAPGQVSATSHSFSAARHTAPALPGGC